MYPPTQISPVSHLKLEGGDPLVHRGGPLRGDKCMCLLKAKAPNTWAPTRTYVYKINVYLSCLGVSQMSVRQ